MTMLCLGVRENSIDDLVFDTLIPKPIVQRYLNLLMEHRRIILSGPSGTGKSYLANKLAHYIINKSSREVNEYSLACFNVDQKSSKVRTTQNFYSDRDGQVQTKHREIKRSEKKTKIDKQNKGRDLYINILGLRKLTLLLR